jgi:hypothetical protein
MSTCGHRETTLLPRTSVTLQDARDKLSAWHFGQEALTSGEREILYVAEALMRYIDELPKIAKDK